MDGLRAIAILLVLGRHATLPFNGGDSFVSEIGLDLGWQFVRNGWLGVDLFFVLSGFLIARTLFGERKKGWRAGLPLAYFKKRMLRTFPLYYSVILICVFGLIPGYDIELERPLYEIAVHVVFLQDYLGTNILVPLWSLATEEKFYLLAPGLALVIWRLEKPTPRLLCLLTLLFVSVGARVLSFTVFDPINYSEFFWQVRAPFHGCLDGLLVGFICFEVSRTPKLNFLVQKAGALLFTFALVIALILLSVKEWAIPGSMEQTLFVIPAFSAACGLMLLASLRLRGPLADLLGSTVMRFFAKLSYSLYLVHYTTINLASDWAGLDSAVTGQSVVFFILYYLLLSFALATLLHVVIEKPFLRLKARI